jgi:hypothetical protein
MNIDEIAERIEKSMEADEATPEVSQEPAEEPVEEVAEEVAEEQESIEAEAAETEEVESEEESEDSEEPWKPESLSELAEGLEVEQDALKAIRIPTKIDGVEGEATLADLIKSYQIDKSLTHKSEALSNERKAFEAESRAKLETLNAKVLEIEAAAEVMTSRIERQYESIDWQQLREDDPAEYVAKRQDILEQMSENTIQLDKAKAAKQALIEQQNAEMQQAMQQRLLDEHNKLMDKIPEWRDPEVMKAGLESMVDPLSFYGFTKEDVLATGDHRAILMARDAVEYRKMKDRAEPVKKKVKSKPKFVKPGSRASEQQVADQKSKELRARLRKTGNINDAAALLLDRL